MVGHVQRLGGYKLWSESTCVINMKLAIIIAFLVAVSQAMYQGLSNEHLNEEWDLYKVKHGKTYHDMEEYSRRLIWEQNLKYIQEHNLRYDLGQHTYFLGVNQFTDMTHEEFLTKYIRLGRPPTRNNTVKFMAPLNVGQLPDTVNWVAKGYVTPVKNQGQCGSCWSFSTTGSLEGQYFRKHKNLVSFSEQQLVDCSQAFGNNGCEGGLMDDAFQYIEQYGIEREQDYPYTAQVGSCQYNAANVVTKVSGFVDIERGNEQDLATAVATQGPISVAIDASNPSFQSYGGGVYNEPECSPTALDHGVLAVGYGLSNGQKYWFVKNSWGPAWGLNGYIKMSKDLNNQCGIATMASYPTL